MLVIGHSVVDNIKTGNSMSVKPGGIFYTSVGLLNFLNKNDEVHLLSKMDRTNFALFEEAYKNFNLTNIQWVDSLDMVELVIHNEGERREHYSSAPESLTLPSDLNYNTFDGILINMINGIDISADELAMIRKNYEGTIYLDVHTLSRGIGKDNHRYFRKIPDSEKWFSNADIVQANEHEILTFCDSKDEKYIAQWTLNLGVSHLIVTKGENGVSHYTLYEDGSIKAAHFEAEKFNSINKVGCGDIFGATLFYNYLSGRDISSCIELANYTAGLITTFTDIRQFFSIKDLLRVTDD